MTFEEFLLASNEKHLITAFNSMNLSKVAHNKLFEKLLDYYFVGGMPEAVSAWFENTDQIGINKRISKVTQIHKSLMSGYERDFGQYSGKTAAHHIQAIFSNVPQQLFNNIDDSVTRFQFRDVIARKNRYLDLSGPISWLVKCKLISKCHPIDCKPSSPLAPLSRDNIFKLFFFDVGLLGYALSLSYKEHRDQGFQYKGYIAENFVQNEMLALGVEPSYSWEMARSEIEFLFKTTDGKIIPVEVKSGKRTRAKSLQTYISKFSPETTLKLVGTSGSVDDPNNQVWPLYFTSKIKVLDVS